MQTAPVGEQLKTWRSRRRLSQMELALDIEISTRHLSFIETGRAKPSVHMLHRLAERLEIPHRSRNGLLLAAGYAPEYREESLDSDELAGMRAIVEHVLKGHEPYPAIAVDRGWNIIATNGAVGILTEQLPAHLIAPPINALRLALHPDGLAPQIVNFVEWSNHLLHRLDQQIEASADSDLMELRKELASYAPPTNDNRPNQAAIAVPLLLDTIVGRVAFVTTVTVFGTPVDITSSELAIEAFFPADASSAALLQNLAQN